MPATGLSLGFGLYGMKTVPLPEALAACARIGYQNVQLCLDKGFPADAAQFSAAARKAAAQEMKDRGLALSAVMRNLNLFGTDAIQAANLESIKMAAQVVPVVGWPRCVPIHPVL